MNKYGNRATVIDNIRFASRKEAARYSELKLLQQAGEISDLRWQVPMPITVNGMQVCVYVADFCYVENGRLVTEDVKGYHSQVYRLKRRLVKAALGINIRET